MISATTTARVTHPIATRRTAQVSSSTSTQGHAEAGTVNRPQLRAVNGTSRAASSSLPFLTVIILVLAGAPITSTLLNIKMASTACRMKEKQIELNIAEDHVETLRAQIQEVSTPDALAGRAKELGVMPAAVPGVVDVNKGQLTEGTPAHTAKNGKQAPVNPLRRQVFQLEGLLVSAALAGRTVCVQAIKGPELAEKAEAKRMAIWVNRAPRDDAAGRDDTVLASSTADYGVSVSQSAIAQYEHTKMRLNESTGADEGIVVDYEATAVAAQLVPTLDINPLELGAELVGNRSYEVIAQGVSPDTWRKIKALNIPGVEPDQCTRRTYPAGIVAGNALGFTHEGEHNRELIEAAGLELAQNKLLTGTNSRGSEEVRRSGVIIPTGEREDKPARPGATVCTTLNPDLQSITRGTIDKTVAAQHAGWDIVMAVESATGKVVVLADPNSVDPSNPSATSEENHTVRSVQAVLEPGSVGKVVTFATILEEGAVKPKDTRTVPYTWTSTSGRTFEDSHERGTQTLTTAGVLAESSNVDIAQIDEKLADDIRYDYVRHFDWRQAMGTEMPTESDDILCPPSSWNDCARYTTMFGQGMAGTTLQLLQVLATMANRGVRVAPRVIDVWIDADSRRTPQNRPRGARVIPEATAKIPTEMLIGITQEGGTVESASINGYLVTGKTGTTETLTDDSTVASFIGFPPARDPVLAIAAIVNRPEGIYGGTVAAPVFRGVMLATMQALNVAPDPSVIAARAARNGARGERDANQ